MATLIIITNSDHVIASPSVYIVKNGKHTGSSTTLGYDKTEERAKRVAEEYKQDSYPTGEIVNLYNVRPTASQYFEYIHALDEYFNSWLDHPRYNERAPELMHKCAAIKNEMRPA